ncbi:MAG: hypothetical protein V2I48_17355, partial [Xanthomonadales bacterium]|nr:hypothetical protein [Xanthomonadales bacterium]
MSSLKPFFLLIQRPLVIFGAIGWMIIATFLNSQLVSIGGDPDLFMDAVYLTVVVLSVYSGWIIGSCIMELQQTSFLSLLPGSQARLLPGFLLAGSGVVLAAVLPTVAASPSPQDNWMLFVVGLGAFATGASIRDPQSGFLTGLGIALFLVLVVTSGTQARLASDHPLFMVFLAAALVAMGLYRLFSKNAIRLRAVNRGRPVLVFSTEKLTRAQKRRQAVYGPKNTAWRPAYLGCSVTAWTRAAWYESYGGLRGRDLLKSIGASSGLFLVLLIEAQKFSGELGFGRSIFWVLHDGLMRSPHPTLTGEHSGAFIMVAIFIIIAGASMALWRPAALTGNMLYPLSRQQKSRVFFTGSFLDMAILLLAVAPVMYVSGQLAGIAAGIQPRFDYVPLFFRAILVTLVMMPFAYWGRLQMHSATWRRDSYSMIGV